MYKLDTNQAKAADITSNRIDEKGSYKGVFTRAQHVVSKNTGTIGIEFDFEAQDGRKARFTIYTIKTDGTQLRGYKTLMALMTCLELRSLPEPKNTDAAIYDYETKQDVVKSVPQFVELLNKPIGIMVTMEEYEKSAGGTAWRPVLQFVFRAESGLMATEILNRQVEPKQAAAVELTLKDRPLNKSTSTQSNANSYSNESPAPGFDDGDIPF